jgi:hypothetical protein
LREWNEKEQKSGKRGEENSCTAKYMQTVYTQYTSLTRSQQASSTTGVPAAYGKPTDPMVPFRTLPPSPNPFPMILCSS